MCVTLTGGMDGLERCFRETTVRTGFVPSQLEGLEVDEEATNMVKAKYTPTFCTTCEAAALCGIIKTGEDALFLGLVNENDIHN